MGKDLRASPSGRAAHEPDPAVPAVPVGIPDADRLVAMMCGFAGTPSGEFRKLFPEYAEAVPECSGEDVPLDFFVRYAQAIEARRAETGTGSVHESAVGNADAPKPETHPET